MRVIPGVSDRSHGGVGRRSFMKAAGVAALACAAPRVARAAGGAQPNILWITSEDNGIEMGCYGDTYATTPNLDALAAKGMIYLHAWSNAPVCAPARTTIISGVYPPALGAEHMRSLVPMPPFMRMYPQFLRERGYYCTNCSKEDYNLIKPDGVWDDSSGKAHWKHRAAGQPFFAIFNLTVSHESQIRKRPHTLVHDMAKAPVPAYHPDTPEVRHDWAQYYDKVTEMDAQAGQRLRELEAAGLADETIVFYYGDHGSGMPRSKRWPYNSGLHVPLIVYVPAKWRTLAPAGYAPGGHSKRLVAFVDLAPTLLSLTGVPIPDWMQGRAFMGPAATPDPPYNYGFRGRMDERYDLVRSIRDERYIYIRNYMPHRIYGQHIDYMFQTPTTRVWKDLYDQGKLKPPRTFFWERKPPEELYDLTNDPDEVRNLAQDKEYAAVCERLRNALRTHLLRTRDIGFLPEGEIHDRSKGSTPYEVGHDDTRYPVARILETAELASGLDPAALPELAGRMGDADSGVRYWAALGILMRGRAAVDAYRAQLLALLKDPSPYVRIAAGEALGSFGSDTELKAALDVLVELSALDKNGLYVSLLALNAISAMGTRAASVKAALEKLPRKDARVPDRMGNYVNRLLTETIAEL